jgi:exopolysaccharide biosynthesis polyprenyl glycosylphosphotransferase
MTQKKHSLIYVLSDFISAELAWIVFYNLRKIYIEHSEIGFYFENSLKYRLMLFGMPAAWVIYYFLSGYYRNSYQKSRLQELGTSFNTAMTGSVVVFFTILLNDDVISTQYHYLSFFLFFVCQFFFTYLPRIFITTKTISLINKHRLGFKTIIVGSDAQALKIYKDIVSKPDSTGNLFVGFVNFQRAVSNELKNCLPYLGSFAEIDSIIKNHRVEEVIVALESEEANEIEIIFAKIIEHNVLLKIIPGLYDILSGPVSISHYVGVPLFTVSNYLLKPWQAAIKRGIDIFAGLFAFTVGLPVFAFAAIGVKLSSKGPIFYRQERIGKKGKPFMIIKFRSMFEDAEKSGPSLSSDNDRRITKFGKFLRKTRLDEIPQFYNVLRGEMSLVGPRPERQYYIDLITQKAPYFLRLLKIKPGITSWGQVKFGYAVSVEEMIKRLYFDINYVENMTLYFDFKILIHTILIVLKRNGK